MVPFPYSMLSVYAASLKTLSVQTSSLGFLSGLGLCRSFVLSDTPYQGGVFPVICLLGFSTLA